MPKFHPLSPLFFDKSPPPNTMSAAMQRRSAIARSIIITPVTA